MPRDAEVPQRAGSLRAMTGLTEPAFTALLPPFEDALAAYLQDRTSDGPPRTSRRYRPSNTCPVPTIADKRLVMLTYLKQNPSQEMHGQLFGLSQSQANTWIHLLHAVLNQAVAHQERLPARHADELAVMLAAQRTAEVPGSPRVGLMGRSERSTALPIPRPHRTTTAARSSATRSKPSS